MLSPFFPHQDRPFSITSFALLYQMNNKKTRLLMVKYEVKILLTLQRKEYKNDYSLYELKNDSCKNNEMNIEKGMIQIQ